MKPPKQHTPTPWSIDDVWRSDGLAGETWRVKIQSGKELIVPANALGATQEKAIANAAFIVRAINAYEKDQKTIAVLARLLEKATGWSATEITQAIAKAEAQS